MAFDTEAERQAALSGGVQMGMIPWTLASAFVNAEAAVAVGAYPMNAAGGGWVGFVSSSSRFVHLVQTAGTGQWGVGVDGWVAPPRITTP